MYCSFCGKSLPDTAKTCKHCGSLVKPVAQEGEQEAKASYHYQENPVPVDDSNPMQRCEPVMTFWQYLLTFILINLPVVGMIFLIVFMFDKQKPNRANMCRAYTAYLVLFIVVGAILLGIFLFIVLAAADDTLASFVDMIRDLLESLKTISEIS